MTNTSQILQHCQTVNAVCFTNSLVTLRISQQLVEAITKWKHWVLMKINDAYCHRNVHMGEEKEGNNLKAHFNVVLNT